MKKVTVYLFSAVFAVIWLSVGVYCFLGYRRECNKNYEEILKEAVYLQTPVLKAENEGKTVIVGGHIDIKETVYDQQYQRNFYSVSVERHLEQLEKLKGRKNTKYWSPIPETSALLIGKANLGEFQLDESIMAKMPKNSESVHKLTSKTKIVYKASDPYKDMTFIGVQKKGKLVNEGESDLETVYEGRLTKEQISEREKQRADGDKGAYIVIFIITTVVAALLCTMFLCVILFFFKEEEQDPKDVR